MENSSPDYNKAPMLRQKVSNQPKKKHHSAFSIGSLTELFQSVGRGDNRNRKSPSSSIVASPRAPEPLFQVDIKNGCALFFGLLTKKREQCCIYVLLPHILRVVSIETNELLLDLLFENLMDVKWGKKENPHQLTLFYVHSRDQQEEGHSQFQLAGIIPKAAEICTHGLCQLIAQYQDMTVSARMQPTPVGDFNMSFFFDLKMLDVHTDGKIVPLYPDPVAIITSMYRIIVVRQTDNKILYAFPPTLLRYLPISKPDDVRKMVMCVSFEHKKDCAAPGKLTKLYFGARQDDRCWRCYLTLEDLADKIRTKCGQLRREKRSWSNSIPMPVGSYVLDDDARKDAGRALRQPVLLERNNLPPQKIDLNQILNKQAHVDSEGRGSNTERISQRQVRNEEFGSPKQSTMRRYKSEKLIDIGDLLDLTALGEAKEEQASGQPGGPGSALFHSQSHDK